MLTKENIITAINALEYPLILDEILERIILLDKIDAGLEQSKNDEIISDVEIDRRMESWFE